MAKQDKSYGYVGVDMPRSIALRTALIQQMIDPEDIYEDKGGFGLEKRPHITVAYGHDQEDPQTAREAIQDIIDGEGTVGGLSVFDNPDYKVLKFDVESPTLHELHKAFRDKVGLPGMTFKDYKPHMTVAYLKKDADPEKYRKLEKAISGMRFPVKMLDFRTPSDKRATILMNRALQKQAADVKYRVRPGSQRYKPENGEMKSLPSFRVLATVDGKQVGLAEILRDYQGKDLFRSFKVSKDHRGKGVGTELLRRLFERADKEGLDTLYTRANPYEDEPMTREQLMQLYAKFGFKPTEEDGDELPGGGWPVGKGPGAMIRKKAQNSVPPENQEDPMNKERLRKVAKIILDIELGDEVLVGRFKNKSVKVESIGTDENGQPTINGRKLLALRIAKKLPKGGPVAATTSAAAAKYGTLRKNAELNKQGELFTTLMKGLQERIQSDYKKRERDYGASVAPEKYHGLSMPDTFKADLKNNIDKIREIVNGMGSPRTWWYATHPDTMYGMDVTPVSDIHDYEYTYPSSPFKSEEEAMAYRDAADQRFRDNLLKLIDRHSTKVTKEQGIDDKRREMAEDYLRLLRFAGPKTFLKLHPIKKTAGMESGNESCH